MTGTFQKYRTLRSSRLQVHHVCESLSLAAPQRPILLVRARAYQATVQFPKELVRSDRRARAAARCMGKFSSFYFLICMLRDDRCIVPCARSSFRVFSHINCRPLRFVTGDRQNPQRLIISEVLIFLFMHVRESALSVVLLFWNNR